MTFGQIINRYPQCRRLLGLLRDRLGRDAIVEDVLEELSERAKGDMHLPRQLMGTRFYIRDVVLESTTNWAGAGWGVTNLHRLVGALEEWRSSRDEIVIYVTFNYDKLLEEALTDTLQRHLIEPDHYIADDQLRVYKLHGSTDWGRSVGVRSDFPNGVRDVIDWAGELTESPEVVRHDGRFVYREDQLAPAVAIPTRSKAGFQCPDQHVRQLGADLRRVDRVAVVGWRAGERRFLDLWRDARKTAPNPVGGVVVDESPVSAEPAGKALNALDQASFLGSQAVGFSAFASNIDDWLMDLLK